MTLRKLVSTSVALVLLSSLILGFSAPEANAATITSSGPLTRIDIGQYLNCDVRHVNDTQPEWYNATACGTFVVTGNSMYSPRAVPAGQPGTAFTPVSSLLSGSGTAADPYVSTVVVTLSGTNLTLTQRDSYVVGDEFYRTDATLSNSGGTISSGMIYTAGDCYLQNSDYGYGRQSGASATCTTTPNVGGRIESLVPITGGNHWMQALYNEIWSRITARQHFPDTCRCDQYIDNGIGLSWDFSVPAGGSTTTSWATTFSPTGISPLSLSATPNIATVPASSDNGYSVTVYNNNIADIGLSTLQVTLPPGFSYTPGSTSGMTTSDPAINGQILTWTGPFTIPAAGTDGINFNVTVSATPGTYTIDVSGTAAGSSVTPLEHGAEMEVTGVSDLALADVATPPQAFAGDQVTYQLTVTNSGPSDAPGVVIHYTMPEGFTFVSGPCTVSGSDLECHVGQVNVSTPAAINIVLAIPSSKPPGTYADSAVVSSPSEDPNLDNNVASFNLEVARQADIAVIKNAPAQIKAGANVTYTINVTNNGPSDASDVEVTDAISPLITATAFSSPTGICNLATLSCNFSSISAHETKQINLVGTVDEAAALGTQVSNTASATHPDPDPDLSNNSSTVTSTLSVEADLQVTKVAVEPLVAGRPATYSMSVVNLGPSVANDVTLVDTLPAGVTFVPELSSLGCTADGPTITCLLNSLLPGAESGRAIVIAASIEPGEEDGTSLTNTATVSTSTEETTTDNNTSSTTNSVTRETDVWVTKSGTPQPVAAGGVITYQIEVHNGGPSIASDVSIEDALPNRTAAILPLPSNCSGSGVAITCNIDSIGVNSSVPITFQAQVEPGADPQLPLFNDVSVFQQDDTTPNNSAIEATDVIQDTSLSLSKTGSPPVGVAGSTLSYAIDVTNNGLSDATDVVVTDELPVQFVAATITAPGCDVVGLSITCNVATLAPAASASFVISGQLNPSVASGLTIANIAHVTDSAGSSDNATETTTITRETDFSISKELITDSAVAGNQLQWLVTITNNGPSDSNGYSYIDDTISPAVLPVTVSGPDGSHCSSAPATFTCTGGPLAFGQSHEYVITGILTQDATGTVDNTARVFPSDFDPTQPNDATVSDPVTQSVDLALSKSPDVTTLLAGESVSFTHTVNNAGPSLATDVIVSDVLPAGMTFDPSRSSDGCQLAGGAVQCQIDQILSHQGRSVVIAAIAVASGQMQNQAAVASAEDDSDPDNNTASATVTVLPTANLSIEKTSSSVDVIAGTNVTYTLNALNSGPDAATEVTLTEDIPQGATFVSSSEPSACVVTTNVSCTFASVASGDSQSVDITLAIAPDFVPSGSSVDALTNAASVSSEVGDSDPVDNSTALTLPVVRSSDMAIEKSNSPNPVLAGSQITYTLHVSNAGQSVSDTYSVNDTLPFGVSFDAALSDAHCLATTDPAIPDRQHVVCADNAPLAVDGTRDFTVVADVDGGLGSDSSLVNTAFVEQRDPLVDPDVENNSSTSEASVVRRVDVAVVARFVPDTIAAGDQTSLLISLSNAGPSTAINVVMTVSLPPGVTIDPSQKGLPGCTFASQLLTCTISALGAGDTVEFSPTVFTDANLLGSYNAVVSATSADDENESNNSATAVLNVTAVATTTTAGAEVLGESVERGGAGGNGALSVTGAELARMLLLGASLLLCGRFVWSIGRLRSKRT